MAFVVQPVNKQQFLPKLVAMCPYEIYLMQVAGAIETIRYTAKGMEYTSPQMGGLEGQRQVTAEVLVLEAIAFEVD